MLHTKTNTNGRKVNGGVSNSPRDVERFPKGLEASSLKPVVKIPINGPKIIVSFCECMDSSGMRAVKVFSNLFSNYDFASKGIMNFTSSLATWRRPKERDVIGGVMEKI